MTTTESSTDTAARLADLEATIERLAAKDKIRDALYTYARAVDRCDLELLKSVYHSDSTDIHGSTFHGSGHDFAEFIVPALRESLTSRHAISNELIVLDGERAFVESLWCSTHRLAVERGEVDLHAEGRYLDVFEARDGEWRILHRVVVNDKAWMRLVPEPLRGATARGPEGLRASPSHDDPVYREFAIMDVGAEPNPGRDPFAGIRALYAIDAPSIDA